MHSWTYHVPSFFPPAARGGIQILGIPSFFMPPLDVTPFMFGCVRGTHSKFSRKNPQPTRSKRAHPLSGGQDEEMVTRRYTVVLAAAGVLGPRGRTSCGTPAAANVSL